MGKRSRCSRVAPFSKLLIGKVVKSVRKIFRPHYDYIEYVIHFTDGTSVRFFGDSVADVNVDILDKSGKKVF